MTIIGLDSVEIEASHPLDGAMTFFLYEISRRSFEVERSQVVGKLFVARASRCGIKKKKIAAINAAIAIVLYGINFAMYPKI